MIRSRTGPQGTFGRAVLLDGEGEPLCLGFSTLELPWKENKRGVSCVPAGEYEFRYRKDGKHGPCYEEDPGAKGVPGRDFIQIHSANLAGDKEAGYVSQLEGCVALGEEAITFKGGMPPCGPKDQDGVAMSKAAIARFLHWMQEEPLRVSINWAPGVL